MGPEVLTAIMFAGLVIAIVAGVPVAFAMLGMALIVGVVGGGSRFFPMMVMQVYGTMVSYILAAIPLFVFMGVLLERSGFAEKLFSIVQLWLGRVPGVVATATIIMNTILAATTGIIGASVTLGGLFALPSLIRKGYDKALSAGAVCASGVLGILIPPSIMLVLYGPMAGISIVKLFAGAVIPGLMLSGVFIAYVTARCIANPAMGPPLPPEERRVPLRKKMSLTLTSFLPPVVIILAVLGTILFGVAAVTEAASIGVVATVVLCIANRALNRRVLSEVAVQTLTVTSMIMVITFAAFVFTTSFLLIGGREVVRDLLFALPVPRWGVLILMVLIYFIMGIFMDWPGIIPILVPLFSPMIIEMGYDPLWFGILCCVCLQTSFLTPPMAPALFYLKAVAPAEIEFGRHIIRGCVPFICLQLVVIALIFIFPQLALWLPSLIGR